MDNVEIFHEKSSGKRICYKCGKVIHPNTLYISVVDEHGVSMFLCLDCGSGVK